MITRILLFSIAAAVALACLPVWAGDPWADAAVQYTAGPGAQLRDPAKALGAPVGGGPSTPDNSSVVSLGAPGGSITLAFATPCVHDARNPFGVDFIVYGNAFWVGGNQQVRFQEPGIVEISNDPGGPWYLIPGSRSFPPVPFPSVSEPDGQDNGADPTLLAGRIVNPNYTDANLSNDFNQYTWGYADMSPTMAAYLDNYVRPSNPERVAHTPRSGGGDAFAIAWAVDAAGKPAGLTQCQYVRITSFITRNMLAVGACSPDIDAVAKVAPDVDTDGDGILDAYETEVAHTDPLRRESTILALEIPSVEGGSPPGTLLGTAEDGRGTKLRLFAADQRTAEGRAYSVKVDILAPAAPAGGLPSPSLIKSGAVREIDSGENDFVGAGIQAAEITIHYLAADIAGLDEASLQPYRFASGAYSQTGLSAVQVNAAANLLTFRSQYPGVFVLASIAGSGDASSTEGPQGTIALAATPPDSTVADPASTVSVISGAIVDKDGVPVPDGTLITVAATAGAISSVDADLVKPGVQVATKSGTIAFTLTAPTRTGAARITATSVEGAAYGELPYAFEPGPAVGPVVWQVGKPEGTAPVTFPLVSGPVRDAFGNIIADGTVLTIETLGGTIVSGDADLGLLGYQVIASRGRLAIEIEAADAATGVLVETFRDPGPANLIAEGTYAAKDYVPMPVGATWALAALLLAAAWKRRRR